MKSDAQLKVKTYAISTYNGTAVCPLHKSSFRLELAFQIYSKRENVSEPFDKNNV